MIDPALPFSASSTKIQLKARKEDLLLLLDFFFFFSFPRISTLGGSGILFPIRKDFDIGAQIKVGDV